MKKGEVILGMLLLAVSLFCLESGNFYNMRDAAFSEFHREMAEYEIDPKLFAGPFLDLKDENGLTFTWRHYEKTGSETLSIIILVPPYFSSFRSQLWENGGQPESWKRLAGTRKRRN